LSELEQRSPEWYAVRCGKVTASRIGDILKTLRNGSWAASRRNYAAQLVTERLTGKVIEHPYTNEYMEWGKEQEPLARDLYQELHGPVSEVGFVPHPSIPASGASPDGLVGDDGLLEIKCLIKANHIDILLTEKIDDKHMYQMLWQMACTGRQWCDFVSYNPELPEHMRLFVKRVHRDEEEINRIEWEVKTFLDEVDTTTKALSEKFSSVE
jgi:putative phage-type endonuclease